MTLVHKREDKKNAELPVWKFIWISVIAERWHPTNSLQEEMGFRPKWSQQPGPAAAFYFIFLPPTESRQNRKEGHSGCVSPQVTEHVSSMTGGRPQDVFVHFYLLWCDSRSPPMKFNYLASSLSVFWGLLGVCVLNADSTRSSNFNKL